MVRIQYKQNTKRKTANNFLVKGPGYTKKTSRSSSCIPNFNQNYNQIKTENKLYSQNLNSKTKTSMKLCNIKYFCKQNIQINNNIHIIVSNIIHS